MADSRAARDLKLASALYQAADAMRRATVLTTDWSDRESLSRAEAEIRAICRAHRFPSPEEQRVWLPPAGEE